MFTIEDGLRYEKLSSRSEIIKSLNVEKSIIHTYYVGGMTCGGCATTVKHRLSSVRGVTSVTMDLGRRRVEITSGREINEIDFKEALNNTHYTISELKVRSYTTF